MYQEVKLEVLWPEWLKTLRKELTLEALIVKMKILSKLNPGRKSGYGNIFLNVDSSKEKRSVPQSWHKCDSHSGVYNCRTRRIDR